MIKTNNETLLTAFRLKKQKYSCIHFGLGKKWIIIALIIFIVSSLFVWYVQMTYKQDLRKRQMRTFTMIWLGLYGYNIANKHLPFLIRYASDGQPADWHDRNGNGAPLYSWRFEILYYLQKQPYPLNKFLPWDATMNQEIVLSNGAFFSYGQTGKEYAGIENDTIPDTNALAITGPGTAFGDGVEMPKALENIPPQTILVVEVGASGTPWPMPGDLDIRTMPQTINASSGKGISSQNPDGFCVIFADGTVWCLSNKIPFETLQKFFTTESSKKSDRELLLGPYILEREGL